MLNNYDDGLGGQCQLRSIEDGTRCRTYNKRTARDPAMRLSAIRTIKTESIVHTIIKWAHCLMHKVMWERIEPSTSNLPKIAMGPY